MVSGTKFYIYGGGRWRELDLRDGRVDGWGRARFAYLKRGKVQVAKSGAVLTALRDLGAGKNSAVKDGAHLPHRITEKAKKIDKKDRGSACEHSRCCHTKNGQLPSKTSTPVVKVSAGTQCAAKADASVQTSLSSQTLTFPDVFKQSSQIKRRRETTTSDENVPKTVTTNVVVHPDNPKSPKRNPLLKRKRLETISSDENVDETHKKKIPNLKLRRADSTKYNIYKRKRTKSSDSIVWVVLPKKKQNITSKGSKQTNETLKLQSQSTLKISEDLIRVSTKPSSQDQSRNYIAGSNKQNSTPKSKLNSQTLLKDDNTSNYVKHDQCKELIIDEEDVEVLRNYLVNNAPDFDVRKFDENDAYKKHFFFKINPLVNMERCPKIARILRGGSQDILSLEDFASQLGLKSITEKLPPAKKYKRIKHDKRTNYYKDKHVSDSDTENSNPNVNKKNTSVNKHTSSGNSKATSSRCSTDSETMSETSDYYRDINVVKRSQRLKESNSRDRDKSSKRYQTRLSGSYKNNGEVNESNKENTRQKTKIKDHQDEVEFNSSKNLKKGSGGKMNNSIVLTDTGEDNLKKESIASKKTNRRNQNKSSKNKNLDLSTNENSEEDIPESNKRNQNLVNENKADNNNSEDEFESAKNANRRGLSKNITKRNKQRHQINVSDSDSSHDEAPESSKDLKQNGQPERKNVIGKVFKTINLTNDTSEDEAPPSSQSANKNGQNKVNEIAITDARNEAISKENKTGQSKILNNNKNKESADKKQDNEKSANKINNTTETLSNNNKSEALRKEPGVKKPVIKEIKSLVVKPKRNIVKKSWSVLREYSSLEDQAIVTWISVGGRACCVNGNRIWREFQEQYQRITGQTRSWHSIRNRYLRYILPSLGNMALDPVQVARLRAAAATGEIKSRSKPGRRNSIFGPAPRGALSRQPTSRSTTDSDTRPPKRHKHDNHKKAVSPSPKRVLRSSLPTSPPNLGRSPRYSEITRHFAVTHPQNDSPPSSSATRLTRNKDNKSSTTKKSSNEDGSNKDKKNSELSSTTKESSATKMSSLRRSFRNKSPAPTINKSPEKEVRTRKLFNPRSML